MPVISQSGDSHNTDMFSNSERNSKHVFDSVHLNPRQIRKEFNFSIEYVVAKILFYLFFLVKFWF